MSCDRSDTVICRVDTGAEVRFPMTAVRAYDADQARRYEDTHETGPTEDPEPETAPSSPSSDCDPDYGGCLDATASDYDCDGGSGDGPEYTGTVDVIGDDHFDLDRDGDGIGCD
jgi:hypothetical protein